MNIIFLFVIFILCAHCPKCRDIIVNFINKFEYLNGYEKIKNNVVIVENNKEIK